MSRIVLSTMGSLGDLHPMIALAIELHKRGHIPVINTWIGYEEKIADLGLEFCHHIFHYRAHIFHGGRTHFSDGRTHCGNDFFLAHRGGHITFNHFYFQRLFVGELLSSTFSELFDGVFALLDQGAEYLDGLLIVYGSALLDFFVLEG